MRRLPLLLALALPLCAAPPRRARAPKAAPRPVPATSAALPPPLAPGELLEGGRAVAIGAPLEARQDGQCTPFPDGRVLRSGGCAKASTEWFDPARRAFTPGPSLTRPRTGHAALRLSDGRVLVLGGTESPSPAEVLDPGAPRFQALPDKAAFGLCAAAVELPDGRALLVDGASGKAWTLEGTRLAAAGSLAKPRLLFRASLLSDGRVLVSGGLPAEAPTPRRPAGWPGRPARAEAPDPKLPAERFDPKKGRWSTLKAVLAPRARHQATLLPDGRVLLWGGHGADPSLPAPELELLDPASDRVESAGRLAPALGAQAALIPLKEGFGLLGEGATRLRRLADLAGLPAALRAPERLPEGGRLANGYLEPTALALPGERVLVLGASGGGRSLERWHPNGACAHVGFLRAGTETLLLSADKRILAVGAVVDQLDPKTGAARPLGWREDLEALIARASKPLPLPSAEPPLPGPRRGHLKLALDRVRVLVAGGAPEGGQPDGYVGLWDLKKKRLDGAGTLNTRRVFDGALPGGALRCPDGTVLLWGGAKE